MINQLIGGKPASCVRPVSAAAAARAEPPRTHSRFGGSAGPESRGPVRSKIRPASREIRRGFQVERGGKRCGLEHEEALCSLRQRGDGGGGGWSLNASQCCCQSVRLLMMMMKRIFSGEQGRSNTRHPRTPHPQHGSSPNFSKETKTDEDSDSGMKSCLLDANSLAC